MMVRGYVTFRSVNKANYKAEDVAYVSVGGFTVGEDQDEIVFDWASNSKQVAINEEGYLVIRVEMREFDEEYLISSNEGKDLTLNYELLRKITSTQITDAYNEVNLYNSDGTVNESAYEPMLLQEFVLWVVSEKDDFYLQFTDKNIKTYNEKHNLDAKEEVVA